MRGCPHAHICIFLHEEDRLEEDTDKIDQMMWAEIPVEYNSKESDEFLMKYRRSDDHRTHRWKFLDPQENKKEEVTLYHFLDQNHDLSCRFFMSQVDQTRRNTGRFNR